MCYCFSGFAFRNCGWNLSCSLREREKKDLWYNDLWNEWLGSRLKFVCSPDVILCGWLGSKHQLTNYLLIPQRCCCNVQRKRSQRHFNSRQWRLPTAVIDASMALVPAESPQSGYFPWWKRVFSFTKTVSHPDQIMFVVLLIFSSFILKNNSQDFTKLMEIDLASFYWIKEYLFYFTVFIIYLKRRVH